MRTSKRTCARSLARDPEAEIVSARARIHRFSVIVRRQSGGGIERLKATVMKDLRYLQHKDWFSNLAFQAFQKYFASRSDLDAFVDSIVGDEEKSRFLKVASHYKFLVKDGRFSIPEYEEAKDFDQTYRFLAICALIEWAEPRVSYKGFYTWLRKSAAAFPIQDPQELKALHEQHKLQFRLMNKMVSFFLRLDCSSKQELESSIKVNGQPMAIEEVARTLYAFVQSSCTTQD